MSHSSDKLTHTDLGRIDYLSALKKQLDMIEQVRKDHHKIGHIFTLEHPPTITLGKNASKDDLLLHPSDYEEKAIQIIASDRGGELTAHMPGQLVIYPILNMTKTGFSVKKYVNILLQSTIASLKEFGIDSREDEKYPGVWIGDKKICAIGIRIKSRISMHGIAINVNNDLELFSSIVPCGILDKGVTSVREQTAERPTREQLVRSWLKHFQSIAQLKIND